MLVPRRMLVVAVLLFACVVPAASAAAPTATQAVAELNDWRALAGLNPVALDDAMSEGCRLHNAYLAQQTTASPSLHYEDPAKPGYTTAGAIAGASSDLNTVEAGPRDSWEGAVYHRMALLQPRLVRTGFDASSGFSCMNGSGTSDDVTVRTPAVAVYTWPANGTRDVPLSFAPGETPSPLEAVPGARTLGYSLSGNVNGPWQHLTGTTVTSVSLTPDGGAPVAVAGQDENSVNGDFLSDGFAIFPRASLLEATWYTVHAVGVTAGFDGVAPPSEMPFDVAWRFQTYLRASGTSARFDRGHYGKLTVTTESPAPVHVTIKKGGAAVGERDMVNNQTWLTGLKPGRYRLCVHQDESGRYAGYDNCAGVTLVPVTRVRVAGNLRHGRLSAVVVVTPSIGRRMTVTAKHERVCTHGRRGLCFAATPFKAVSLAAAARRVVRIAVPATDVWVQVTVAIPAGVIDGIRFPRKTVVKVFRAL